MKPILASIGSYAAIFGILSTVLYFFDMELNLLVWVDNWGETTGWIIRIGLIVVGAALYFMFRGNEEEEEEMEVQEATNQEN